MKDFHKILKKGLVTSALVCGLGLSPATHAGIDDIMDSVINANPTSFKSSLGNGQTGGYYRFYAPKKTYNLLNVSAPHVDAGCGGIDMYGGSFSFINGPAFKNLLKQVAQNAIGYIFQLAFQTICPSCNAVLSDLAQKLNDLNALASDSCKLAQGIVGFSVAEMAGRDTKLGSNAAMMQQNSGMTGDYWDSYFTNVGQSAKNVASSFTSSWGSTEETGTANPQDLNEQPENGPPPIAKLSNALKGELDSSIPEIGISNTDLAMLMLGGSYQIPDKDDPSKMISGVLTPLTVAQMLYGVSSTPTGDVKTIIAHCVPKNDIPCDRLDLNFEVTNQMWQRGYYTMTRQLLVGKDGDCGNDWNSKPSLCKSIYEGAMSLQDSGGLVQGVWLGLPIEIRNNLLNLQGHRDVLMSALQPVEPKIAAMILRAHLHALIESAEDMNRNAQKLEKKIDFDALSAQVSRLKNDIDNTLGEKIQWKLEDVTNLQAIISRNKVLY